MKPETEIKAIGVHTMNRDSIHVTMTAPLRRAQVRQRLESLAARTGLPVAQLAGRALTIGLGQIEADLRLIFPAEPAPEQPTALEPALADLAESEGRRADDLDAEKRSMREILSELHKMLTRATDAALKGQVDSMRPVVEAVRKMQDARDAMNHGPIGKQEIGPGIRTNGIPGIQGRG